MIHRQKALQSPITSKVLAEVKGILVDSLNVILDSGFVSKGLASNGIRKIGKNGQLIIVVRMALIKPFGQCREINVCLLGELFADWAGQG